MNFVELSESFKSIKTFEEKSLFPDAVDSVFRVYLREHFVGDCQGVEHFPGQVLLSVMCCQTNVQPVLS
jgi:hypothetical protein